MAETFLQKCLNNEVSPNEIEDFIARWHDDPKETRTLTEFLGLTDSEYGWWVSQPSAIHTIVCIHKANEHKPKSLKSSPPPKLQAHVTLELSDFPSEEGFVKAEAFWQGTPTTVGISRSPTMAMALALDKLSENLKLAYQEQKKVLEDFSWGGHVKPKVGK